VKKILLIIDGNIGNKLLDRLKDDLSGNEFHVLTNETFSDDDNLHSKFIIHKFDSTSFLKVSNLLKQHSYSHIAITLESSIDCQETLNHIRFIDKHINVSLLDSVDMSIEDQHTFIAHQNTIMANQMVNSLPDIPKLATNIGLGEGELMEVLIPFGSSYAYKNINAIVQKDWLITIVYRNDKILLPNKYLYLQPNDTVIISGKPHILHSVYRAINNRLGQFPLPYGKNLYFIIDFLETKDSASIYKIIRNLAILSGKLKNNRLFIKIINPNSSKFISTLREEFENRYINMQFDISYDPFCNIIDVIKADIRKYNIGLVIVTSKMFLSKGVALDLYNLKIPILKLGKEDLSSLKKIGVLIKNDAIYENISSAIFDIAKQFNFDLTLFDIDTEDRQTNDIIEHYRNTGKMFDKTLKVKKSKANPIIEFKKLNSVLQVNPFSKNLLNNSFMDVMMSVDFEKHLYKLDKFNQILIPV
jgi:hypothetical protein